MASGTTTQDFWYKYDSMNRFTVTKGSLSGTTISAGSTGSAVTYRADGQRATVTDAASGTESYSYTADGLIRSVAYGGSVRVLYNYDAMGRNTIYSEYDSAGTTITYGRTATYDAKSQVTQDIVTTVISGTTTIRTSDYAYRYDSNSDGDYIDVGTDLYLGAVTHIATTSVVTGGTTTYQSTLNNYVWYDGAVQISQYYTPDTGSPGTYVEGRWTI